MDWLRRWNFLERARIERDLWEAFERGESPEALVEDCRRAVAAGEQSQRLQLEVWETTLGRIRKIEALMRDRSPSGGGVDR